MEFKVEGVGLKVWGGGLKVQGLGSGACGWVLRVEGPVARVGGLLAEGVRIESVAGVAFWVQGFGCEIVKRMRSGFESEDGVRCLYAFGLLILRAGN